MANLPNQSVGEGGILKYGALREESGLCLGGTEAWVEESMWPSPSLSKNPKLFPPPRPVLLQPRDSPSK